LARAFNRARVRHPFYLTGWVFLPDPAAPGHRICAPVYPVTISLAMKSVKESGVAQSLAFQRLCGSSFQQRRPRAFRGLRLFSWEHGKSRRPAKDAALRYPLAPPARSNSAASSKRPASAPSNATRSTAPAS
jgi:hypothetical protein